LTTSASFISPSYRGPLVLHIWPFSRRKSRTIDKPNDVAQPVQILEGISGGFFSLDQDYRFTYWNRAAEEGTGLKREEVLGKNVFEIFPNAKGAELGDRYRIAMESKSVQSFETAYKDDRFEAWYNIRIYPAGNGISVLFHDVTDQKRQQRQKEALLEISRVFITSRQVDELCLKAAEKIGEFLGIPSKLVCIYQFDSRAQMLHLVSPSMMDIPSISEEVAHKIVHEAERSLVVQCTLSRESAVTSDLSRATLAPYVQDEIKANKLKTLICLPLVVQNDVQGVLEVLSTKEEKYIGDELGMLTVIANELSTGLSRRRLVDEIALKNIELETEKLKTEEANEVLKRFLATFSHELRAPLNSIVGFSELLADGLAKLSNTSIEDFMKNINESGKHLQDLVNDILDLSKIEAGKLDLYIDTYPVSDFVESVSRVLQNAIQQKMIDLQFKVSDEVDQLVVDQTRFKQILVNLVANAIKYSDLQGRVIVSIRRVENEIEVVVKDEGPGIKPEDRGNLFRPFQQSKSEKGGKEGTGLGLAITKRLIELHGGFIWVESALGKGTSFCFRIPMMVGGEVHQALGPLLELTPGKALSYDERPLVLIVEDNPQASQLIQTYLQEAGYRTETARDGEQALEKAKTLKPKFITLDVLLPIKDGWHVLKELRSHPICKDIPVIIISIVDEKKLGFTLGAVEYFVKPVNREDLLRALSRIPAASAKAGRSPKVLVIDDDKAAADLIEVILEPEGYQVVKSFDGRDGLRKAASDHPDIILLDLIMPEISGFNVAYQLRQQPETSAIPIIVLTSMEIDQQTREQMEGYALSMMSKQTFTKTDLLKEIGSLGRLS
jgi:PAS domain S-box-containing protein